MAAISTYLQNALLNHILRGAAGGTALAQPANVYCALYTTAPTQAGPGTEIVGGAYARQPIAFSVPAGGSTSNGAQLTFPVATANWGTIVGIGIHDALTNGNMLYYGTLTTPKQIGIGDQFIMNPNNLTPSIT